MECLSSRNCAGGLTCDVASGRCVPCKGDVDCPQERPYCTAEGCVECRSTQNCGDENVECVKGKCGTCGDGVCSRRERAADLGSSPLGLERSYEVCEADCRAECERVKVSPGQPVRLEIDERNLFESFCSVGSTPDASAEFTARSDGIHTITVSRTSGGEEPFSVAGAYGACPGESPQLCGISIGNEALSQVDMVEGDVLTIIVESLSPGLFELSVTAPGPCQGPLCAPGGEAGAPNDQGKTVCLEAARARGEDLCSSVTCACSHCPRDYDDCAVIPGCREMSECFRSRECIGEDCYSPAACSGVISAYGGLSGPAFRAANALQSCDLGFSCGLPCGDGGKGETPDAGAAVCSPGAEESCGCGDAGTGKQTCNEDGTGYSACRCAPRPAPKDDSSCDCTLARRDGSGAATALLAGLLAALSARRTRRSARPAR